MDDLTRTATDIEAETSGTVFPIECDVRNNDEVSRMIDTVVEEFGGLNILVNNAGAVFDCSVADLSENAWRTIVDINLNGVFNCTRAARAPLKENGGTIVNISSIRGQEAAPEQAHYGAAKAGIINFTETVAAEWATDGIRVNCVAPGFIATSNSGTGSRTASSDIDRREVDRQVGTPAEVANVVQFLASPAASFITGETVTVRGVPPHSEKPL